MDAEKLAASKKSIDERSYESLLSLWRNAPSGHPYFEGELGTYYAEVMAKKKAEIGDAAAVAASKSIGWD